MPKAELGKLSKSFCCVFTLFLIAWQVFADATDNSYQLGKGYNLGDSGFRLGGYADAETRNFGGRPTNFSVNGLSLFLTWDNGSKLRYFSETEVEDLVIVTEQRKATSHKANFRLERVYFDYLLNDRITVRMGKMLTPIGLWNVMHASPLVWTTTRPVATNNLFSEHATGLMLQGVIPISDRSLEYAVYSDYSSTLDPRRTDGLIFDNAQGLRLRYSLYDNLQLGFSYADYALMDSRGSRNHLAGLDIAWSHQGFAINSELVFRQHQHTAYADAWQGYIQGVSPLVADLYAVARYEFFDQASQQTGEAEVLGLAYRPKPPLVFKLEYRLGKHNRDLAPDGLYGSIAVLF